MARGTAEVAGGELLGDRYRIGEVLGHGGMSTVYRAHDELLDRDVAVKVFPPAGDEETAHRQRAEMHLLAQLSHPGLVTLHDAGTADAGGSSERSYLVMELVPGPTLADLVGTGALSPRHTARVGAQLAAALAVVHASGVVHRDIKPANVLLVQREVAVREDPEAALVTGPVVKLADFGIARMADSARLTMTGTTLGTATYLSPEQAAGTAVGPATDVYALGLVLLECLTGERAFTGTVAEVAAARLTTSPRIPAGLGPGWRALLTSMTARDPAERVPMAEVAVRLGALSTDATADGLVAQAGGIPSGGIPTSPPADDTRGEDGRTRPVPVVPQHPRPGVGRAHGSGGPVATSLDVDDVDDAVTGRIRTSGSPAGRAVEPGSGTGSEEQPGRGRVVAGSLRTGILLGLVVVLGLLLALQMVGSVPSVPTTPTYPAVEGPLGEALDDLARSVRP